MKRFFKQALSHFVIFLLNVVTLPLTIIKVYNAIDARLNQWANSVIDLSELEKK